MSTNEESKRVLIVGRPDLSLSDNRVSTSKYTVISFFPIAIREQFRRNGNIYFLLMGILMAIGYYTDVFQTAISPWTTLGPLAVVVAISLAQEGAADLARHRSDNRTNNHPCAVLKRSDELNATGGERDDQIFDGEDLTVRLTRSRDFVSTEGGSAPEGTTASVAFQRVRRKNIRAGDLVLVRNRDMIPADLIVLASSGESGNAYIETSSIDGETNLKLRTSPSLEKGRLDLESVRDLGLNEMEAGEGAPQLLETLEQATKRIVRNCVLGYPEGTSATENPANPPQAEEEDEREEAETSLRFGRRASSVVQRAMSRARDMTSQGDFGAHGGAGHYVAVLTSEPPNASVNTYSGKLTLPPVEEGMASRNVALGAENVLLRGAILRNTEWAIGVAVFTGKDTKLVKNSFQTPSKFSGLDKAINRTVFLILFVMLICVFTLAGLSVRFYGQLFDQLWYAGFNQAGEPWPYFPKDFAAPDWIEQTPNYGQQVFLFITLLNNFVPLSLYVTMEVITLCMMIFMGLDKDLYHAETDTPAVARSTIVTDLGQVKFIFSDKTGTLTQNVMRFKRCSVDGMVFGAPVEKSAPQREDVEQVNTSMHAVVPPKSFHPLRQLLLGKVEVSANGVVSKKGSEQEEPLTSTSPRNLLTFNAEMFLRVMSICHTVVVEKDFDATMQKDDDSTGSKSSFLSSAARKLKGKKSKGKKSKGPMDTKLVTVSESNELKPPNLVSPVSNTTHDFDKAYSSISDEPGSQADSKQLMVFSGKGVDGAPVGHNYQAESPDEGALVSAASLTYDFQFLGRDSSGVTLSVSSLSLLSDENIVRGLKNGSLTPRGLSAETASPIPSKLGGPSKGAAGDSLAPRFETWTVLAINKFDSDRKRMSVLVRSPPELGSLPMLLCKGADSAMLDGKVCDNGKHLMPTGQEGEDETGDRPQSRESIGDPLQVVAEDLGESGMELALEREQEEDEWEMGTMLGVQAHLGDFASEGLRTLVLGVRVLTEKECESWLETFKAAATSITDRDKKLTEAALAIEQKLHIVGATAIEDKLQDGVPETIHDLEEAGIKLWVLTGDKRETAIEIGYSTKVLTPSMRLTEVADGPSSRIKTMMAMEFIRLVKCGKLPDYQHSVLDTPQRMVFSPLKWKRSFSHCWRSLNRFSMQMGVWWARFKGAICCRGHNAETETKMMEMMEAMKDDPIIRRKAVRELADSIIEDYMNSEEGRKENARRRRGSTSNKEVVVVDHGREQAYGNEEVFASNLGGDIEDSMSLSSDSLPAVFNRAQSAREALDSQRNAGQLTSSTIRTMSIASVTSRQSMSMGIIDEDMLSLASFLPDGGAIVKQDFDKKKRTVLEKLFAVDRYVRHGQLGKHLHDDKIAEQKRNQESGHSRKEGKTDLLTEDIKRRGSQILRDSGLHGPRALVIEGAALAHLLGDAELEEMLFAVASACDAVIACRVSPKQKALLVRLVRKYVSPTPVTLAIGDGANDVGMIQEAHVGIGISGLEGQQAVNSSDFAIAQFRFLRDLLLIHGRWNFVRLCKVALYSFYKNAFMAGTMIVFQSRCLYSGTPLYDQWVIAMLNFVAGIPILFNGMFDRDLDKDYVRRHPIVYASGPNGDDITLRVTLRWVLLCVVHIFTVYFLSAPALANGGGITSAFSGLMANNDLEQPGDGEGGDLKVFGTVIFSCLIVTLGYKIFFETRSIIHGEWPAFTLRKGVGEGWPNRLAYTWIGVFWLSYGFYLFGVYVYSLVGRGGASTFSAYTMVAIHTFNTRSITWMVIILVPTAACVFDVTGKLFSNMYYPTQTQIHMEIQAKEVALLKKAGKTRMSLMSMSLRREIDTTNQVEPV